MKKIFFVIVGLLILVGTLAFFVFDGKEIGEIKGKKISENDGILLEIQPVTSFSELEKDIEICEGSDDCFLALSQYKPHPQLCELISDSEKKDQCLINVAPYFEGVCDSVSSGKKDLCLDNVWLVRATTNEDISLCENISDSARKESCRETVLAD